jgi:hypothetical protein
MDARFERIQSHIEGCLRQAGVFGRSVDGAQLLENEMIEKAGRKWILLAAGISDGEAHALISAEHKQERAAVPIEISPDGTLSILLILRPLEADSRAAHGAYTTDFSSDVGQVELYQGCYVRVDGLSSPAIQQIRWELDPVAGHKPPIEEWLRPWAQIIGCNPGHPPSHWHVNSPPIELPGRRQRQRLANPPELRLAVGLPNPLLLILSLANWLHQGI